MSSISIDQAEALAIQHFQRGQLQQAEGICRQILGVEPNRGGALNLLAAIANQVGRNDLAIEWMGRAAAAHPGVAMYQGNLAELLRLAGRFDEAENAAGQAVKLSPNSAEIWFTLGTVHLQTHGHQKAIEALQNAIRLRPEHADAHNNLGAVYEAQDRLEEAVVEYQRAIQLTPAQPNPHNNLGVAYARLGRLDEAIACYRKAVSLAPDNPRTHSHLIYTLLHDPGYDAETIFQEHLAWAKQHTEPLAKLIQPHTNSREANRRITIGYVSPNFRSQAVAYFTEPIITNHDRERFRIICYHDCANLDDVTRRFSSHCDLWRPIAGMGDDQVAQLVRQDQVDILVDLTGHIPNNRLLMFARKPSPVQVTYIGYQTTTGMSAMDYRITDAVADPVDVTDRYHTEKLVRLPLFFCYKPLENSPGVSALPAERNGAVTFGSMNNFVKVGPAVIALWSQILKAVPGSRLMILIGGGSNGNAHVLRAFAEHGIGPERLQLVPMRDVRGYLELFNEIDIALDPFPFSGHTTTCDALWMGVPVVTLAGQIYPGRMASSVLTSIDRRDWIAQTHEQYLQIAIGLAGDIAKLTETRAGLRGRFEQSPAMDAAGFTRHLEDAYRQMWREWCSDKKHATMR